MAQQRTPPQQRNSSLPRPPESAPGANPSKVSGAARPPEASSKPAGATKSPEASSKSPAPGVAKPPEPSAKPSGSTSNLKDVLDELGAASEAARLQLHLLAVEARQRTGELSTRLENVERGLDRGFHQALATAAERARQLSKTLQASFTGGAAQKSGQIRVGAVMTDDVHVCSPEDPLYRPAQIMWEGDCGSVPVVESGRVCGMVTDRDICMAALTQGRPLHELLVNLAMARHVIAVGPDSSIGDAEQLMSQHQIRRLPVLDAANRPLGVISLNDIAIEAVQPDTRMKHGITKVAHTLAAVCQPHAATQQAA